MCGIVGVVSSTPVNQMIYDALLLLQHRGQDAAGIATQQGRKVFMHKARGMVKDVFRTRNMRALPGNWGIGHVRYPTAGSAYSFAESQPFYVNSPFGIVLGHNGNLTNAEQLKGEMFRLDRRHINTNSDSEVLLNVLAHELQANALGYELDVEKLTEVEKEEIKKQITEYHTYWSVIHNGDYYRLTNSVNHQAFAAWEFVSKDKKEVLFSF